MFCPNCGCWNPDDSQNCSACATSLQAAPVSAAPANAVSATNGFANRWRKIATSPIMLVLLVCIAIHAILNVGAAFDQIGYAFDVLEYNFLATLLYLGNSVSLLSLLLIVAGMALTVADCFQKDKADIDSKGIALTCIGVAVQLIGSVVSTAAQLLGSSIYGNLLDTNAGGLVGALIGFAIVVIYYILLLNVANSAKNNVATKTFTGGSITGAAVVGFVAAALVIIGLADNDAFTFDTILAAAAPVLQSILLLQYKSEMSK